MSTLVWGHAGGAEVAFLSLLSQASGERQLAALVTMLGDVWASGAVFPDAQQVHRLLF